MSHGMPITLTMAACLLVAASNFAQDKPTAPGQATTGQGPQTGAPAASQRTGPRPYKEVVTDKAVTRRGLFSVHNVEAKWYFEIPDSLMGRDILVVSRISKSAAGLGSGTSGYAGDIVNNNVIRFAKGPKDKVFLHRVSYDQRATDEKGMYRAVANSGRPPIMQSFDVRAYGNDSVSRTRSTLVELTDYLSGDNDVLFFSAQSKSNLQLGTLQSDRSYVSTVRAYPVNLEIQTVKTYVRSALPTATASLAIPGLSPGASSGAVYTLELNSSLLLLPKESAKPRYIDARVGYFSRNYTDFDANPQGVKVVQMAVRWRLEPKPEDVERYLRGELVEPRQPIVYHIDPATPAKWVPYLIQGVNDWQVAFERAGFKNAIVGKPAPTPAEDSTWSLEDARFSAIVYKPSTMQNASGPNVHDPRSGQILESHVNWYHNVMQLLRNWYFIQAAAVDSGARKMQFDDELMGQLIRFVSSHEVGHTLGLRHNYGSSSTVPVDSLRSRRWVEENGHTPSIMDYARFNYVAQPEDNVGRKGLFPRIGEYDKWAIEWGYRWLPQYKTAEDEVAYLQRLTTERLKDKRLWFGTELNTDDPRSQNEDLGDDAMKAGAYGVKNLQRIMANLIEWTAQPNTGYDGLAEMHGQVVAQFGRYMGHVAKNVAGVYETPKTREQPGAVYDHTPRNIQKEAMRFLNQQLFTTPSWLLRPDILSRTGVNAQYTLGRQQETVINTLLSAATLNKLYDMETSDAAKAYRPVDFMDDLRRNIFSEVYARRPIDIYRRNLQKIYVERIASLLSGQQATTSFSLSSILALAAKPTLNTKYTDTYSVLRGTLRTLRSEVRAAALTIKDAATRMHLEDLDGRMTAILEPQ